MDQQVAEQFLVLARVETGERLCVEGCGEFAEQAKS
jgi:hypothetical protein